MPVGGLLPMPPELERAEIADYTQRQSPRTVLRMVLRYHHRRKNHQKSLCL
jgi:hypothetical protein